MAFKTNISQFILRLLITTLVCGIIFFFITALGWRNLFTIDELSQFLFDSYLTIFLSTFIANLIFMAIVNLMKSRNLKPVLLTQIIFFLLVNVFIILLLISPDIFRIPDLTITKAGNYLYKLYSGQRLFVTFQIAYISIVLPILHIIYLYFSSSVRQNAY